MEETNLGNLIENAVKQIEIDKEKESRKDVDIADDEDLFEEELFKEEEKDVRDADYTELQEQIEKERLRDLEVIGG